MEGTERDHHLFCGMVGPTLSLTVAVKNQSKGERDSVAKGAIIFSCQSTCIEQTSCMVNLQCVCSIQV